MQEVTWHPSWILLLHLICDKCAIVAIGLKRKDTIHNTFEKLELLWDEYEVYDKGDSHSKLGKD